MKKRIFLALLWMFVFVMSICSCTTTQKQSALCYSGCILNQIPACVKRCKKESTAKAYFSREPLDNFTKAKEIHKQELKKDGKSKKR